MLAQKLLSGGGTEEKLYVDDVFSTYLYTGNGGTQTINNGIDLAGKGGLVWIKRRDAAGHFLADTVRGANNILATQTTAANTNTSGNPSITGFLSTGFTLGGNSDVNGSSASPGIVSWTFRKAPKFFDVVTYTGNGVAGRQIPHELGIAPGMVIVKRTDASTGWVTYHHSLGATKYLMLNETAAAYSNSGAWNAAPSATVFNVGSFNEMNASGGTYVAYLFAHDPSADGIIQCGSFTTDGSGNATVNLGWEPQFLMVKCTGTVGGWFMFDSMRRFTETGADYLAANSANSEEQFTSSPFAPRATGFRVSSLELSGNYIYLAIRRPNKPPTSGTQVFTSDVFKSSGTGSITRTIEFPPDFSIEKPRSNAGNWISGNRLTAWNKAALFTALSDAEADYSTMEGVVAQGANQNSYTFKQYYSATPYINYLFKRAPGFFDVVCYTGTGASIQRFKHNLRARPELILVKSRSTAGNWLVTIRVGNGYWRAGSSATGLCLNEASGSTISQNYDAVNTETEFAPYTAGDGWEDVWTTDKQCVAYLFASLPGISKVGNYAGNGTTQTIPCGFTTGARFILVKRTDAAGDWYVWDSARGIVAANDPHLSLNTTVAEVTSDDSVDPHASGFIVNQVAATNINVSGGQYIFLAIA